jgi:hypothetical protein
VASDFTLSVGFKTGTRPDCDRLAGRFGGEVGAKDDVPGFVVFVSAALTFSTYSSVRLAKAEAEALSNPSFLQSSSSSLLSIFNCFASA